MIQSSLLKSGVINSSNSSKSAGTHSKKREKRHCYLILISHFLYSQLTPAASLLTELDLSLWLRCAADPILTLEDNMCVCVCLCDRESPISGRFSTAPNSQTLRSGRPRWQSWHLSLSGWERVVCEWPGAGWDTLNHLHHVSVGLHAWVCTSGCAHMRLMHESSSANV